MAARRSKVILAEHYPTHVIEGASLSIASACLVDWLARKVLNINNTHETAIT